MAVEFAAASLAPCGQSREYEQLGVGLRGDDDDAADEAVGEGAPQGSCPLDVQLAERIPVDDHQGLGGRLRSPADPDEQCVDVAVVHAVIEVVRSVGAPDLTPGFLAGEFRAVVLALPERTRAAHLAVKRPGRGVRLNRVQRAAVWNAVEAFERAASMQGRTTFELLAARAADILADPVLRSGAPAYDHVVVDEAQDLHAGHWRVLRGLVPPDPDDLFLCEDGHQRIYGERIVLSRFGIETRGRSRRLTLNYRTSRQNLAFALGVIGDASVRDLDGDEETVAGYHSTFAGPVPVLRGFRSQTEEMTSLVETVRGWLARPVEPAAIAVLSRQGQERARQALQEAGIAVEVLTRDGPGNPGSVKIASMHRAKGTEFSCVVIVGAEAGVVPLSWLVDEYPEPERAAALGRERSLFYVACSRARDELVVSWSGSPSPLLPAVLLT